MIIAPDENSAVFAAADLTAEKLFALLQSNGHVEVQQYYVSTSEGVLWLTDPYGGDRYGGDMTIERCAATLERIASADPKGTERDPW